ncbi:erythroid transcription factor-like [Amphiprion ocellaris]|uniref:erythroid transcription factor-like n=1 Tax=Amphiprion ocellaris TaxID=80972 RepID=UPI0024110D19|nr:erythroid transcription factor-like [Amphiprion ocellaris]
MSEQQQPISSSSSSFKYLTCLMLSSEQLSSPLRNTAMMSHYWPAADWSLAVTTAGSEASVSVEFGRASSETLLQSPFPSHETPPLLGPSLWLDNPSCQSAAPWTGYYGDHYAVPSPSAADWMLPGGLCWGRGFGPEQRQCVSCGSYSAPLWRRDAAGQHLCNTCSLQQTNNRNNNAPLLRPKRRTTVNQKKGTECFNCQTKITTLWRRNSAGESVCNACGLYYKLHQVNRPLALKRDGIQTRKRKLTNKKTRQRKANQSEAKLSSLAPPTDEVTTGSSSSPSLQLGPLW